jgi:NAD(P)-dependent dehydrogenase (short-subunit alcohol dehydrogenase family)
MLASALTGAPDECRRVGSVVDGLGPLDLLVHSPNSIAPLAETDEKLWDSSMNVNARRDSCLPGSRADAQERRGRVVRSPTSSRDPARHYLAHAVSKAAVEGLVRALAVELP